MRRLPPGQIETRRFPVVGERAPGHGVDEWTLRIHGLVDDARSLTLDELMALAHREVVFDIHCVTGWTRFDSTFTGVPLAELARPRPDANFVSFGSYSARGHHTSLPVDYAMEHSWVVHSFDGGPLEPEHGGPVRVVTPGRYFYKSLKWLRSVEFLADDRLGWWELNSSYHNGADPTTGDQRFTTGSVRPDQLRRFLEAASYDKYRGRVMLGLDLREWVPKTRSLHDLQLKNCDLRGVDLSGADLRRCNLSLSDLSGAVLHGADLAGSDLEGADLGKADLRHADLSHCALSATRFQGARVEGARAKGSWGLVESEQRYLESMGVEL